MLTSIQSAGLAPEVNLRNSLHAGDKACKRGIHIGFETQGRCRQKSKTRVSVAPWKGLMSSNDIQKFCFFAIFVFFVVLPVGKSVNIWAIPRYSVKTKMKLWSVHYEVYFCNIVLQKSGLNVYPMCCKYLFLIVHHYKLRSELIGTDRKQKRMLFLQGGIELV